MGVIVVLTEIQPLQDGNGCLGCEIAIWLLLQSGRNMLKQHLRALVEHGHLDQQGGGRGVWCRVR